jgi:hypothetical protein
VSIQDHTLTRLRLFYEAHGAPQLQAGAGTTGRLTGWLEHAACGGMDPELFFGLEPDCPETYLAQSACLRCPVRRRCDSYATTHDMYGVWGGIYRFGSRYGTAALCPVPGCLRYRRVHHARCGRHTPPPRNSPAGAQREEALATA